MSNLTFFFLHGRWASGPTGAGDAGDAGTTTDMLALLLAGSLMMNHPPTPFSFAEDKDYPGVEQKNFSPLVADGNVNG